MKPLSERIPRRRFISDATLTAGALSAGALAHAKAAIISPTFTYDIDRFRDVDPKLIRYTRTVRFPVPKPEPRRIAIGPDQRLRVAAGNSILTLDLRGGLLGTIATSGPVRSVALALDGILFAGIKDHIEVFDTQAKRVATWDAPKGRPLLTGIAVGGDDVFVADAGNRIVWRYDRSGKVLGRIGEKDEHRNIAGFVVPSPFFDVEFGFDGLLRVANPGRRLVETYTINGDLEFSWGKAGAAIDAFCGCCNPCNIELLPDGRVVTFEKGLPRVKVYSAKGELDCVVAAPSAFADPAEDKACDNCNYGGLDGAVDAKGNIFVLDLIGSDIHVLTPKPANSA